MTTRKILSIAALAAVGALSTIPAQANDSRVQWSVQIGLPLPVITLPAPRVVVAPAYGAPVYGAPVYGAPVYGAPVYVPPPAWRDRDRDGVPDWRDRHDNRRHGYGYGYGRDGWNDRDRDGVPNRYDRHDNRLDNPGSRRGPDRDRDGVPDWRDRYDNRR